MFKYLLLTALLYFISYLYYVKVSHGLGHKAEFLQLRPSPAHFWLSHLLQQRKSS